MSNVIRPVKGTVDYYPEQMAVRAWLYERIREVSQSFGYQEYEGPFLETIDLYVAKSGEEIVEQQSYVFEDRGGDRIALRPELTPTLARMVAQRQKQLVFPLRWWSFGPFWRYERPQKGRSREFFQWNIDLIGDDSPEADAELATVAASFFKALGITPDEAKILVNNRQLMDEQITKVGIQPEMHRSVHRLIDRRDKLSAEKWDAYARELGLDIKQLAGVKALLEKTDLWKESESLRRFFKAIDAYGVGDYVKFAPHIIRGLDYYTGTVFEAWDTANEFRTIFGGGRYDDLVDVVGGDPVPATGFAVGNVVITLLLEKLGRLPETAQTRAQALVTIFDADHHYPALVLSSELRAAGLRIATYPSPEKLGKQFKYADRTGVKVAVVLGPEELAGGQVAIKNLESGEQKSVARKDAAGEIAAILEEPFSS
jgi:histidyl-tRNA synthetase